MAAITWNAAIAALWHRLDFSITPENGLELRVYRDEEKTFNARRDAALAGERKQTDPEIGTAVCYNFRTKIDEGTSAQMAF